MLNARSNTRTRSIITWSTSAETFISSSPISVLTHTGQGDDRGVTRVTSLSNQCASAQRAPLLDQIKTSAQVWLLAVVWIAIGTVAETNLASAQEPAVREQKQDRESIDFFENRIRPVLVDQCYSCHSIDAQEAGDLQGGLLLDSRESSRQGGDSGPAVVPSNPDDSLILSALRYEEFEMPPDGKLDEQTIADFERWIEMGATDPRDGQRVERKTIDIEAGREFWSLQPLTSVPDFGESLALGETELDRFIERRQVKLGTDWNPPAAADVLIRRAWFDVLGLPPTPGQIQDWTARLEKNATVEQPIDLIEYRNLLDHLFASPRYGERWARHWMDVVRFAESHGYEQDYDRPNAYHYRDFLIQAFNADMPFDQFLKLQLAGDELEPENPLALMATGFLGAGSFPTQLTEAEFESARYDELDDIVSTIGVAFLGLSVGCARCHDHKFDPIPSRDYYRMAAVFTNTIRTEVELDLKPEENANRVAEFERRISRLREQLSSYEEEELEDEFREYIRSIDPSELEASTWQRLEGTLASDGGSMFERLEDGSYLASGNAPRGETLSFETEVPVDGIAALRLEALAHESLPRGGPGRAPNGNFALGDIRLIRMSGEQAEGIEFERASATHQQNADSLSVKASIDQDRISGWAVDGQIGKDQAAVFWLNADAKLKVGERIRIELDFHHPNTKHAAGRIRFSTTRDLDAPVETGEAGTDRRIVVAFEHLKREQVESGEDWNLALAWFKTTHSKWGELVQELADLNATGSGVEKSKVLICSEGLPHLSHHADGRGYPHFYPETYYLRRGDVAQKVEKVEPGYLSVLVPPGVSADQWRSDSRPQDRTSYRRAALADWMVDTEQGAGALAARVIVNRLWQHHFGRGLVDTPNDFGRSGEQPTHPELLDWLANELIEHEWKLKPIHKQIMLSRTYMQSSSFHEAKSRLDIDNRTWWRREPRRLEAEAIRDSMLFASGQLDTTMFGPGTLNPNMKRRSVYFFIKRSKLIPMMMLFDWPEHLVSIGSRSSTTIAPQALMFMNDPFCRSLAENLADSLQGSEFDARVNDLFWRCLGRAPSDEEISLTRQFVDSQHAVYEKEGQRNPDRQAWIDLCLSLFSTSEFLYVD